MKTSTIKTIEAHVVEIENSLTTFVLKDHTKSVFGSEGEHTAESLKFGLKSLLGDIRGLTNEHDEFVRLSSHVERNEIVDLLTKIKGCLDSSDYASLSIHLDELKVKIRSYNLRTSTESEKVLTERINRLNAICGKLEENVEDVGEIRKQAQAAQENIQLAIEQHATFTELFNNLKEMSGQLGNLQQQDQSRSEEIKKLLTSAKSNEGAVTIFANRIGKMENQLSEQEQKTQQYETHLAEYQEQHEKIQKKAGELTVRAEEILSEAATANLGGALNQRYKEESKKWRRNLLWLLGAAGFVLIAMWLGYMLVSGQENITLGAAVARLTILSVAVSGAWFCASQYVRYRNILDDYGYKSVLAMSIVAFLDQFTDPQERADYLKIVLGEIHQDPLRKKHDIDGPASRLWGWLGKEQRPEK